MSWQRINITAVGAWYGNFTFAKRSDGPAASKVSKLNRIVAACCAEYQADLDIINDKAKVFCNPFVTQQSTALTELSSKSLILMVPPHGLEPRTY